MLQLLCYARKLTRIGARIIGCEKGGLGTVDAMTAAAITSAAVVTAGMALYGPYRQLKYSQLYLQLIRMKSVVESFRSIAGYLPGDIPPFALQWGLKSCGGAKGYAGDGDGLVRETAISGPTIDTHVEADAVWCHMYQSHILPDIFTVNTDRSKAPLIGNQSPMVSGAKNLSFGFTTTRFDKGLSESVNYLGLGKPVARNVSRSGLDGFMDIKMLKLLDMKYDNGLPNGGRLLAGGNVGCGLNNTSASYNVSNSTPESCTIYISIPRS